MSALRTALLLLACAAQLALAGGSVWRLESGLTGTAYRFETAPVDPVDPFRGRYVALAFPVANVPIAGEGELGGEAYARVEVGDDGLARLREVYVHPPEGIDSVPVEVLSTHGQRARVRLAFDRFYLPEEQAPLVEQQMRDRRGRSIAVVRVRPGHAVLEELRLDDAPGPATPLRERLLVPAGTRLPQALLATLEASGGLFESCGVIGECVAFEVDLRTAAGPEYVVQDPNGLLHHFVAEAGAPELFLSRGTLRPRRGRAPRGGELLALLEQPGGVESVAPPSRDLRIGETVLAAPE